MAETSLRIRLISIVGIALLCACCSACIVPLRVPTKTTSVSGETGKKLDLEFIKVGTTAREEVGQKLGWAGNINTLSEWISKDPSRSVDLSMPIDAPIEYIRSGKHFLGTLVLSKDDLRFLQDRERPSNVAYDFKTSPGNISHLSLGSWVSSDSAHPENVVVTIHFRQKTAVGSKLPARMDLPTMMILLKYIRQTQLR